MIRDVRTTDRPRPQRIVRHRTVADAQGIAAVVGGVFVLTVLVTVVVSLFTDVQISGWDIPVGLSRWYAGAIGVYLTVVFLPLYVAHGRTRREFLAAAPAVVALTAAMLAGAVTLGYVLESFLYGVAGWSQGLTGWSQAVVGELDGSVASFLAVAIRNLLLMVVWLVGGMLAGAAFYRRASLGIATIPLLVIVAGVTEAAVGSETLPQLVRAADEIGIGAVGSTASAVTVSAVCVLLCGVLVWMLVRDQPLRTRDG